MKKLTNLTLSILLLCISNLIFSQTITYDKNYSFTNLEVAQASLSNKGISLILSEVDTRNLDYDGSKVKPHYRLIIDVDALYKLPFPIKPSDSVRFYTTQLQTDLNYNLKVDKFLKSSKGKKAKFDAEKLKKKAQSKQARIKALSKRVANGDMSAMKELEKITQELTNESEDIADRVNIKEETEKSTFDLVFLDYKTQVENKLLSGYIYIKEFSKNRFVATFSGKFISECLSKNLECNKKQSNLVPEIKILKEGDVRGTISVPLKKVFDDR